MTDDVDQTTMAVPPPPRNVVPTHPAPILKALGRILLVAVILATILLWVALVHELLFRSLGHEIGASVTSIHEKPGNPGSPYTWRARYQYSIAGGPIRADESRISWTAFNRLRMPYLAVARESADITIPPSAPTTLSVRAYEVGPLVYSRALEHEWGFMFMLIPAMFAPTGALLSFALYVAIIVRPRRHKRLYTHGHAVSGVVTGKVDRRSKYGITYWVYYSFNPEGAAAALSSVAMVPGYKEYDAAITGQTVTILYDPSIPKRSTIYEYCGYRWA